MGDRHQHRRVRIDEADAATAREGEQRAEPSGNGALPSCRAGGGHGKSARRSLRGCPGLLDPLRAAVRDGGRALDPRGREAVAGAYRPRGHHRPSIPGARGTRHGLPRQGAIRLCSAVHESSPSFGRRAAIEHGACQGRGPSPAPSGRDAGNATALSAPTGFWVPLRRLRAVGIGLDSRLRDSRPLAEAGLANRRARRRPPPAHDRAPPRRGSRARRRCPRRSWSRSAERPAPSAPEVRGAAGRPRAPERDLGREHAPGRAGPLGRRGPGRHAAHLRGSGRRGPAPARAAPGGERSGVGRRARGRGPALSSSRSARSTCARSRPGATRRGSPSSPARPAPGCSGTASRWGRPRSCSGGRATASATRWWSRPRAGARERREVLTSSDVIERFELPAGR